MKIAHLIGFVLGLLLISCMYSSHAEEFVEDSLTLTCSDKKEVFIIPFNKIKYVLIGINGTPNCVAGIDTAGEIRTICDIQSSPIKCVVTEEVGV